MKHVPAFDTACSRCDLDLELKSSVNTLRASSLGRTTLRLVYLAMVLWLVVARSVLADTLAASDVKAGFVYNFSKFVEWPASALPPNGDIQLCVLGKGLDGKLSQIHGRISQGREIQVRPVSASSDLVSCHILYVGTIERSRLVELLKVLEGSPVLTVSDIEDFTSAGGMIGLYVENERVRFAINLSAMRAVGLKPSAQLVRLGKVEP